MRARCAVRPRPPFPTLCAFVTPSRASLQAGTFAMMKDVVGKYTVYCRFGNLYFDGIYRVKDNTIHCVTKPAYVGTSVTMYLSLNKQQFVATQNGANDASVEWKWAPRPGVSGGDNSKYSYFSFYDQTRITKINPDRSPLNKALRILVDFRYSCGFRDRKDTLCKFGNQTMKAAIVPEEEQDKVCSVSGHPCLFCTAPPIKKAQIVGLSVALNGINFCVNTPFVVYGVAMQLWAVFQDAQGRQTVERTLIAGRSTIVPDMMIEARDIANNVAFEDVNNNATVKIEIIKMTLNESSNEWNVDSMEPKSKTGVEPKQPWQNVHTKTLKNSNTMVTDDSIRMVLPLSGTYKVVYTVPDSKVRKVNKYDKLVITIAPGPTHATGLA